LIPLESRIWWSTTSLHQWLAWIDNQAKTSESLYAHATATQLSLHQVLSKIPKHDDEHNKFPPWA
jgi:hypothetical protein